MSVIALTDDTGTILERYAYDAYGEPVVLNGSGTVISGSAEDNRYTYTGREWDADLALYHFRARMYDPKAGRFLGRDPLGFVDGANVYRAYFHLLGTDPQGTGCKICLKPLQLVEVVYEEDDPDEIESCIYKFEFDEDNPQHFQMLPPGILDCDRRKGCIPVLDCRQADLRPFVGVDGYRYGEAVLYPRPPVQKRWWGEAECPEPDELPAGFCIGISGMNCPNFRDSLRECMRECQNAEAMERYCYAAPNKALKRLCLASVEAGQDACRDFCRMRNLQISPIE
jgi:RHS repeat-associated protein